VLLDRLGGAVRADQPPRQGVWTLRRVIDSERGAQSAYERFRVPQVCAISTKRE
jgi:hypothetical protein